MRQKHNFTIRVEHINQNDDYDATHAKVLECQSNLVIGYDVCAKPLYGY